MDCRREGHLGRAGLTPVGQSSQAERVKPSPWLATHGPRASGVVVLLERAVCLPLSKSPPWPPQWSLIHKIDFPYPENVWTFKWLHLRESKSRAKRTPLMVYRAWKLGFVSCTSFHCVSVSGYIESAVFRRILRPPSRLGKKVLWLTSYVCHNLKIRKSGNFPILIWFSLHILEAGVL